MEKLDEELTGERTTKSTLIGIALFLIAFSGLIIVAVLYIIHELKNVI